MTKPHKWANEIKAWADGAKIEVSSTGIWFSAEYPAWSSGDFEFRIKPQPKEKQYLYVYKHGNGEIVYKEAEVLNWVDCFQYRIGKIEVLDV